MNQYVFVLLSVILTTTAEDHPARTVSISNRYYMLSHYLKEGLTSITDVSVRRKYQGYDIFFRFKDISINAYRTAYITQDLAYVPLAGIPYPTTCHAFTQKFNGDVLIGTTNGIFTYTMKSRTSRPTRVTEHVLSIGVHNDEIFYVNTKNEVYVMYNEVAKKFALLDLARVTRLVVNNKRNIVGMTVLNDVVSLSHNGLNFHVLDAKFLTVDQNNVMYAYAKNGTLYEYNDENNSFQIAAVINDLQGIGFVSNDLIAYAIIPNLHLLVKAPRHY